MKKRLTVLTCLALCCLMLAACGDGSTTMDGGKDTDGKAGETTNSIQQSTSGENGEGAQGAVENITGGVENAIDDATDAVDDVTKGVSDAVKDTVDNSKKK